MIPNMRSSIPVVILVSSALFLSAGAPKAPSRARTPVQRFFHASDTVSDRLDRLGATIFDAERRAYELAGSRFFQDPEDAQGAQSGFYLSSLKVLRLAVAADSTNASAAFHLGQVMARKSYKGWGEWDIDTLRASIRHLSRAQALAVGRYNQLRPAIDASLRREQANLDSLRH